METTYRVTANGVEIDSYDNYHKSISEANEFLKELHKKKNVAYCIVKKTRKFIGRAKYFV